jgi:hypothetical protein
MYEEVTATGRGWEAGHGVNVQGDDGTKLRATTVGSKGGFKVSFTVPRNASEGRHTVYLWMYRLMVERDISSLWPSGL